VPLIDFDRRDINRIIPPLVSFQVQKTGFPFYDACQLTGAMHYFFGGSTSTIEDKGAYWIIQGPKTTPNVANYRERLRFKGLERIEQTTLIHLDADQLSNPVQQHKVYAFFNAVFPKTQVMQNSSEDNVSRFLEPSWLTGSKGFDAAPYGVLASQRGLSSKRPIPEMLIATLGLTQAALAYGNDEVMTVLPILKDTIRPTQPFLQFKQRYQHKAGSSISAIFASLSILVELEHRLDIQDFAFAYHGGRGFYYSGLLGLNKLCSRFRSAKSSVAEAFARQALRYFERTSNAKPGPELDLARLLANFIKNPSLRTLDVIIRAKSRILANAENISAWTYNAAVQLLSNDAAIQGVNVMSGDQKEAFLDPKSSNGLIEAVADVLREYPKGSWIGRYIELERASNSEQFHAKINRMLSRSLARSHKEGKTPALFIKDQDADVVIDGKEFAAYKQNFLMRLLNRISRVAKTSSGNQVEETQETQETPAESSNPGESS
jgi:hypothetical protein